MTRIHRYQDLLKESGHPLRPITLQQPHDQTVWLFVDQRRQTKWDAPHSDDAHFCHVVTPRHLRTAAPLTGRGTMSHKQAMCAGDVRKK